MDSRLVLVVLFMTLSWIAAPTAGSNTTISPNTTMTPAMTTPNMSMGATMTTLNSTMGATMTTPNMTMGATMTTPNMTMGATMTTMNSTMGATMTTPNMTMGATMTTLNSTMGATMTTLNSTMGATMTTEEPSLTPNTTVGTLETPISNAGCGKQKFCAAEPSSCDPSKNGSCFFFAAKRLRGRNFEIELSGESEGYIAASLDSGKPRGEDTYICANNNGAVEFFGAILKNGELTLKKLPVNSVTGEVKGQKIQCKFSATVPTPATRASTYGLKISSGSFNSTSGALGNPNTQLKSSAVDLENINSTVVNELFVNTTASPNTTTAATGGPTMTTETLPLTPNTTVGTLETPISNAGCRKQQFCAAQPFSCNPSKNGSCFFLAAKRLRGRNFEFELSGESEGYIAATLNSGKPRGEDTYICANNNGAVEFFGAVLKNGKLTLKKLPVNSVTGKVKGKKIQCKFSATVPTPATRAATFGLEISSGSFNSTSGALGNPNTQLKSSAVNLENINSTVVNELSVTTTASPNTTTAAPTTAGATTIALQQSLTQALLITAGVLVLAML